ncbi:pyridoxamine 5'-phosphate oxidase family protein [Fodinicola acaciae]|uniref:pyridoxamine 5'-phosphate oxidase family protein n=1 Tax=Fodinicola acaciae TaxID=2681555 RepID=UPI0013D05589|nr:pyridoxamine 5'-phosphate oxidase family protein [Fodinicola acaciae]
MPGPMSTAGREAFLAAPQHLAIVSVASGDGRPPLASPVFYHYEAGGELTFFTNTLGRKTRKAEAIDKAGAVTVTVQTEEMPYKYVTVEGTIVGSGKPSEDQMFAIARRYMPDDYAHGFVQNEFAHPDSDPVLYAVRPDRWYSSDLSETPA